MKAKQAPRWLLVSVDVHPTPIQRRTTYGRYGLQRSPARCNKKELTTIPAYTEPHVHTYMEDSVELVIDATRDYLYLEGWVVARVEEY